MADRRGTGTFVTDATELTTSHLDLYTAPVVDNVLQSGHTVEIYPSNALTDNGPYEFYIPRDPDHYIQLPLTRLYGTVRVVKLDGTDMTDAEKSSVCNMFPHSLFKQVEIEVEGKQINDLSSSTYPIKAFMETVLTYGKDAQDTHLTLEGFYEDDWQNADKGAENAGWVLRRTGIAAKNYHFSMIIHADFFQMERFLLPNTSLNIKFIRNADSYSVISPAVPSIEVKIQMKSLNLEMRKVKISDDYNHAIQSNLSKEVALYPITQGKIKSFLIQSGTSTTTFQNILSGSLPQSLVIAFLHENSFNANCTANPFIFAHFGLNSLNVKIGGKPIHPRPLQPDYDDNKFTREYRQLFDHTGIHHGNLTNNISQNQWKSIYNFYPYDFSADLNNSAIQQSSKLGYIDVDIGFKKALGHSIYMIVYSAHPCTITIDQHRNVELLE
jgi:hypothetical protein